MDSSILIQSIRSVGYFDNKIFIPNKFGAAQNISKVKTNKICLSFVKTYVILRLRKMLFEF